MTEKLRNFQACHNFPKNIFLYWKSKKKLEDNASNILKSSICRAMEYLNVTIMFEMLFMFYHLKQKCLHSRNVWEKAHQMHHIFVQETKCSITISFFSFYYKLSYICFTCYHYINYWFIYLLYIFCMMNVVRMWEGNMQWKIKKLLRKFRTKNEVSY